MAIQLARGLANREEMELSQFNIVIDLAEQERKALSEALTATTGTDKNKKPDHSIRLRAAEIINEKIAALQPRGRGAPIQVGVQVGVNNNQPSSSEQAPVLVATRATSFEEIVRKLDAENERALPAAPPDVIEAPVIEAEPDGVRQA